MMYNFCNQSLGMLLGRAEIVMFLMALIGVLVVRQYIPGLVSYHRESVESPSKFDPIFVEVLKENTHITRDPSQADIVLPSGARPESAKRDQVLMHVSNENVMMDRNMLWKTFVKKGGRDYAKEFIPEIFVICNSSASDDYEIFLQKKIEWPSTMFRPFLLKSEAKNDIEGLYMSQADIEDLLRELKNNNLLTRIFSARLDAKAVFSLQYTVIQQLLLNPFIVMSRTFKLELYLAFTNRDGKTNGHLFPEGLVYWARTRWNKANKTIHNTIASRSMMRKGRTPAYSERIYARYPHTLQALMTSLGPTTSRKVFNDVLRVLKELCKNVSTEIGNEFEKNDTMNLYAVEVMIDEDHRAWLMQLDRPRELKEATRVETEVRKSAWQDVLKINNVLLDTTENRFKTIFEQ